MNQMDDMVEAEVSLKLKDSLTSHIESWESGSAVVKRFTIHTTTSLSQLTGSKNQHFQMGDI